MSGTYRTTLVYTKDGHYGRGNNARTAAAEMRKIDRRKKRREAGRIKREAMREYEIDAHIEYEEMLSMEREAESCDLDFWGEIEREQFFHDCEMMRLAEEREEWERAERYHREMEMMDYSYEYGVWDY